MPISEQSPFSLTDRKALVVGAAAGSIGAGIAAALAVAGADVAVADLPQKTSLVFPVLDVVRQTGREAVSVAIDVADRESVESAVRGLHQSWGRIDIVVNAAAIVVRKAAVELDLTEWRRVIDVNLTGTWSVNQVVGRLMIAARKGKIINIASQQSTIVGPMPESAYYASKAAVVNLTRALASEWGRYGVNVNAIAPGFFYPTNMTRDLAAFTDRLDEGRRRTMLGRLGDPNRDIGGPVVFLASDASDYVTGHVLYVDGGWTAW